MNEYSVLLKLVETLGSTGLILAIVWKLTDRWAGKFLEVSMTQARALGELAAGVKETQGEARELLLAVRVLATKIDDVKHAMDDLARRPDAVGA